MKNLSEFFVFLENTDVSMDNLFKIIVATNHKMMKVWRELK